jgi:hypothetical protein
MQNLLNRTLLNKVLGLILLGTMSRLLPHPPNFTAINAIALFGIYSLGSLGASIFTVFSALLLTDLVFGFHSSMIFVYLSYGLNVLLGYWLKSKMSLIRTTFLLMLSSLLFFIITNFGVWLHTSLYPKTVAGLELCYLAAIPFHANNLIASLLYGGMLFKWFAVAKQPEWVYLPESFWLVFFCFNG